MMLELRAPNKVHRYCPLKVEIHKGRNESVGIVLAEEMECRDPECRHLDLLPL